MSYEKHQLKNKIKVILKHKNTKSVQIQLNFNVGSIHETKGERGFSHLVEHLLFEGTKKRKDATIICSEIENLGGEINAATSNENTFYYIKVPAMQYKKALDVLSDMTQNSTFEPHIIKKEKQIVLEEIKMVNDQPRFYQWVLFEKTLLKNTIYQYPVYGLVKDVKNATQTSVKNYYQKHYLPKNTTITIIGNIKNKKKQIKKDIKRYFESWNPNPASKNNNEKEIKLPINKKQIKKETKDIQQTYLIQGTVTQKVTHKTAPAIELIEAILGKPQSGRINDEIRTKLGLAYDVSVSYDNFQNFSIFAINVGTDPKNIQKIKQILKEQYKLKNLTKKELQDAKNYIKGKEILELENTHHEIETINFWENITQKDYSKEHRKRIQKTTLNEIKTTANELFKDITEIQLIPKHI